MSDGGQTNNVILHADGASRAMATPLALGASPLAGAQSQRSERILECEKEAGTASAPNGEHTDAGPRRNGEGSSHTPHGRTPDGRSRNASAPSDSGEQAPISRSEAQTLVHPSHSPPGGTAVDFAHADTLAALEADGSVGAPAEWCLDFGERLLTLSTYEAWAAIARGDVTADVRAWREGLECWTRVDELAELSCALAETPRTPEPVMTEVFPESDSLAAFEQETIELDEARARLAARTRALAPPRGLTSAIWRRVAAQHVQLGAAVAVIALAFAALGPTGRPTAAATRRLVASRAGLEMAAKRLTVAALASAIGDPTPQPAMEVAMETAIKAAEKPSIARRGDRGQRRQRRSSH